MKVVPNIFRKIIIQITFSLFFVLSTITVVTANSASSEHYGETCNITNISADMPNSLEYAGSSVSRIFYPTTPANVRPKNYSIAATIVCESGRYTSQGLDIILMLYGSINSTRRSVYQFNTQPIIAVRGITRTSISTYFIDPDGSMIPYGNGSVNYSVETLDPYKSFPTSQRYYIPWNDKRQKIQFNVTIEMSNVAFSAPNVLASTPEHTIFSIPFAISQVGVTGFTLANIVLEQKITSGKMSDRCPSNIFMPSAPAIVDFGSIFSAPIISKVKEFTISITKKSSTAEVCSRSVYPRIYFKSNAPLLADSTAIELDNGLTLRIKKSGQGEYVKLDGSSYIQGTEIRGDTQSTTVQNKFIAELTKEFTDKEVKMGPFETTIRYIIEYP
ncbi:hypothetical protein B9T19_02995 [Ignatzschineria sp. F8392]|uniref:hypothetical protein n=1 Tax=Ignatzschineria sp. F8392 TaxID=1980117 RepID=UPI000B97D7D9|nr:hypothetical protein [Ignatzschineria sp. F8392]OYQ81648.1 hypothetical protein B9T19_02995 [Ignatzschineria sp. F8392]